MSQEFIIKLIIPDGVSVSVEQPAGSTSSGPAGQSFEDLPALAAKTFDVPTCPQHGPMKHFPGGISQKNGKPYNGRYSCIKDCPTPTVWDKD